MSGTFQLEYAKSNRSTCKACSQKIDKDVLRIGKMGKQAAHHTHRPTALSLSDLFLIRLLTIVRCSVV